MGRLESLMKIYHHYYIERISLLLLFGKKLIIEIFFFSPLDLLPIFSWMCLFFVCEIKTANWESNHLQINKCEEKKSDQLIIVLSHLLMSSHKTNYNKLFHSIYHLT